MEPLNALLGIVVVGIIIVCVLAYLQHRKAKQAAPGSAPASEPLAVLEGVMHSIIDKLHHSTPVVAVAPVLATPAPAPDTPSGYAPADPAFGTRIVQAMDVAKQQTAQPSGFVLSESVPQADPVSTFLGPDTGAPAKPAVQGRDAMRDGPTIIVPYLSANYPQRPGLMNKINRIANWWAQSGSTIPEAVEIVDADKDQPEAYQKLAEGQRLRDEQANIAGVDFKGFVDVARLSLEDGFYLSAMNGRYAALTGEGDIYQAMMYGSATACNAFINLINSTNAGRLGTYDPATYQGQLKALVEAKIGGL
jgi:hypothetical protein